MSTKTQVLTVTRDPKLRDELQELLSSLEDGALVTSFAQDNRQAVEVARSRGPEIALVEMRESTLPIQAFAREMAAVSPGTTVVGVIRDGLFAGSESESQVLIDVLRSGVKDFLNYPFSLGELQDLVRRVEKDSRKQPAQLGAVVAFVSNKGGVGKSTLAINTAVGLARQMPDRVLLVDASLQLGVAASMLDLQPVATLTEAAKEQTRLDTTLIQEMAVPHSSGLHLLAAPRDAVEAAQVDDEVMTQVLSLARRSYDFVIVDTFPVFDAISLAILDLASKAFVVTENVVPTLLGTAKLIELLDKFSYPVDQTEIILNRQQRVAGSLHAQDIARRLGRDIDWIFPYDRNVISAANTGQPLAMTTRGYFGFGRELKRLIKEVSGLRGDSRANGVSFPGRETEVPVTNGHPMHPSTQEPTA
ncbi:CpaE family protein [Blastopirellula marina]|uniref:Chromosome partitioning protein n=1 Tax=Blastopirellula marina TaxID=124 RepID=A0A2S8G1P0_9BACT|nr:AAA family ATPase [Blastopirellula marina]PQO38044.1 chromosome partitioning protein [Blastopirellula marina]PTL44700.1 chromosome partitioning protein [Blastopirellula marina]